VFYNQFIKLCNKKEIAPSKAALLNGISKTSVTRWKKGATPNAEILSTLAKYFNVTTDYLLGNEQKEKPLAEARDLSDIENEILTIFHSLPEDKKQAFMTVARSLKSPTNNSKDK